PTSIITSSIRPSSSPSRLTTRPWINEVAPSVVRDICMSIAPFVGDEEAIDIPSEIFWLLPRRDQPALAVGRERDARGVELIAIPQLARHLLVLLVERLAVVGELTATDLGATALPDLGEPVGVGEALARRCDDVGLAAREQLLGLAELADPAGGDHRRLEP